MFWDTSIPSRTSSNISVLEADALFEFYCLSPLCIQIGLFAVDLSTPIPKSMLIMILCFSQKLRNFLPAEVDTSQWSPAVVTAAVAKPVGCRVSFCQACCTFPFSMLHEDREAAAVVFTRQQGFISTQSFAER